MKIYVTNRQKDLKIYAAPVKYIVKEVLKNEDSSTDELSIHFVTQTEIARLHQEFFNDPSPTDCISFPLDQDDASGYHLLGEIFVCPLSALNFDPEDPYREVTLYIVHGLLHLLGYDDITKKDLSKMRAAERWHMQQLENKNMLLN